MSTTARVFGGNIDLCRLYAAVGLDDAFRHRRSHDAIKQAPRPLAKLLGFRRRSDERADRGMLIRGRERQTAGNKDGHKQRRGEVADVHCKRPPPRCYSICGNGPSLKRMAIPSLTEIN
jgi:hypothetical protein